MKRNISIAAILLLLSVAVTSCLTDLDLKPNDPRLQVADNVFTTPLAYKQALAKIYAGFATTGQKGEGGDPDVAGIDEGFSNYLRQYWSCQELSTDEAVIGWNDATIKDFHWQTWTANDGFITAMYARIFYNITLANEFIRQSSGNSDNDIQMYNAEARFIRAVAYWHALDLFGSVPFITEADKVGSNLAKQKSRAEIFDYVEKELLALEGLMAAPKTNEYGRADKAAAWMVLAKLYLNAEVYTGVKKYNECATYCKKIIDAGYSLEPEYNNLFCADNHTSKETIFAINFDGLYTRTWGGMVFLIHAPIGGSMDPTKFGIGAGSGWGGVRTTKNFVAKFPNALGNVDKRGKFYTDGQSIEIEDMNQFTNGYAIMKYNNLKKDGSPATHADGNFVDTDFPMFRLADVYLMYAEAVLRGATTGDKATAVTYVNKIRERAYGNTSGNITDAANLTLDYIIDERARELFWEGHRRTDLIRFGMFTTDKYLWAWKGKVPEGKATESWRNIYPIPTQDLGANPNLKQNTGY